MTGCSPEQTHKHHQKTPTINTQPDRMRNTRARLLQPSNEPAEKPETEETLYTAASRMTAGRAGTLMVTVAVIPRGIHTADVTAIQLPTRGLHSMENTALQSTRVHERPRIPKALQGMKSRGQLSKSWASSVLQRCGAQHTKQSKIKEARTIGSKMKQRKETACFAPAFQKT